MAAPQTISPAEKKFLLMSRLIWGGCLLSFVAGLVWPAEFWGVSALGFMPWPWIVGFFGVSALVFLTGERISQGLDKIDSTPLTWRAIRVLLPLGLVLLAYNISVVKDIYGDAPFIYEQIAFKTPKWDGQILSGLISLDFSDPKLGNQTIFSLVNGVNYLTGWKGNESMILVNAISLGLFQFLFMGMVARHIAQFSWRIVLSIVVAFAPFTLMFYGHLEIYPVIFVAFMAYLSVLDRFFQEKSLKWLIFTLLAGVFTLKFHISGAFFAPSWLYASVYYFQVKPILTNHQAAQLWINFPLLLAGAAIYLFVTKSYHGPRYFTEENLYDAIFLPVRAAEGAPLDRYNLFSTGHLVDYFNLVWIWSPGLIWVLLSSFSKRSFRGIYQQPVVVALSLSLLIFVLGFFVLNPLFSLQYDWDLCAIPAIVLMVLCLHLVKNWSIPLRKHLVGPLLALVVMGFSWNVMHTQAQPFSERMEATGKRFFQTYWIGASSLIEYAIETETDSTQVPNRIENIVQALQPDATLGKDPEYGQLLRVNAKKQQKLGREDVARANLELAYKYAPNYHPVVFDLFVARFVAGDYRGAMDLVPFLVEKGVPSKQKSLRMAIHTSLEAADYAAAKKYCAALLQIVPTDSFINSIYQELLTNPAPTELKYKFRRK